MNIVAIVVTYYPKLDALGELLNALRPQVNSVVIVDNGSDKSLGDWLEPYYSQGIHGIFLGTNTGVAAAQNTGIAWARQHGADHVVLFDQDSVPALDMIDRLAEAIRLVQGQGHKVGAVGPRYVDDRNEGRPSFSRLTGLRKKNVFCKKGDQFVSSDFVISSGALIPISTLDEVGQMIDGLFIDQVDIEWCLRAKSFGFQSYGVCGAEMRHSLGEAPLSFLRRKFLHHGPLRHYYIFRNAVWLLFKPYVPLGWKWLFVRTLVLRFGFYISIVPPRLTNFRMMALGIWHGLRGRLGPFRTTGTGLCGEPE